MQLGIKFTAVRFLGGRKKKKKQSGYGYIGSKRKTTICGLTLQVVVSSGGNRFRIAWEAALQTVAGTKGHSVLASFSLCLWDLAHHLEA